MMSDIVKQIVLKFKTEGGPEVQRQIQAMTRGGAGGMGAKDVDKTLSNMTKLNKEFSKAGMQMSNEFSKVKKIFEEINSRHVDQFSRKIERVTKLMANQGEELDRLMRSGAAQDRIDAQVKRMGKTNQLFNRMAENSPENMGVGGGAGGGGGGIPNLPRGYTPPGPYSGPPSALSTMLTNFRGPWNANLVGLAAGGVGWAAGEVREYYDRRGEIRSTYANRFKENASDVYQGNLGRSALATEGYNRKVEEETNRRMRARDISQGAYGLANVAEIVGGVGTALAAGAATVLTGGIASPVTLAAGAGGLAMAGHGAYGLYQKGKYAFQGRDIERAQTRAQVAQEKLNETMTPELYAQFRSTQRQRMQFANEFGINSNEMYGFRMGGYGNQYEEGEAMQAAQSLRRFGSGNALSMAGAAMTASRMQGTSLGSATGQISAMALNAVGGEKRASDNLRDVFSVGVASGIKDSGMLDNFKELVGSVMANAGTRTDAARMADVVAKSLNTQDVREMSNLQGGFNAAGALIGGRGGTQLDQQLMFNSAVNTLKGKGITGAKAISLADQLSSMSFEQGMAGGNATLQSATGMNADEIKTYYLNQMKSRVNRYTESRDTLAKGLAPGASEQEKSQAIMYIASKNNTTIDQATSAFNAMAGNSGGGTKGAGNLDGKTQDQIDAEGQAQEAANLDAQNKNPETKAEKERFKGISQMDKDVQDKIATNIDNIINTYKDTVVKSFQEVGVNQLNQSVTDIVTAADKLAVALSNAADRINGGNSYGNSTPSNNEVPQ